MSSTMRIHSLGELFEFDGDDCWFLHTKVCLQQDEQYFWAESPKREDRIEVGDAELEPKPIPFDHIWPNHIESDTICLEPEAATTHIKHPHIVSYDSSDKLGILLRHEIGICERLKEIPHKNIAKYLGCVPEGNRVSGICFTRYHETLLKRLQSDRPLDAKRCLDDVKAGIDHLHGHGFVHNDLGTEHVMLTDDDTTVIIDFDSCVAVGEPLLSKRGKVPDGVETSEFVNDFMGLERIRVAIESRSSDM